MLSWSKKNKDDCLDDEVFNEFEEFDDNLNDSVASFGVLQWLQLIWLLMCAVICSISEALFGERAPSVPEQCLNWANYVEKHNR